MIVTWKNIGAILAALDEPMVAVDTETTGLRPHHGDELFSIILATETDGVGQAHYFNFKFYPDAPESAVLLGDETCHAKLQNFFSKPRLWCLHNAKFDLSMLRKAGFELAGEIHDSMALGRVVDSTLFPQDFGLDAMAQKLGHPKDDGPKKWIIANKAFTTEKVPGKKTSKKNLRFDLVPWDLIVPYGERDAAITMKLAAHQTAVLLDMPPLAQLPPVTQVAENERALTRTVFEMEWLGVQVDLDFCRRAAAHAEATLEATARQFKGVTGEDYLESTLTFQRVFKDETWVYGEPTKTGKTNPSFDSDVLASFKHPAAKIILDHRKAKSDADYYHGFVYEADPKGVIHASFNQHAVVTGRFSSSNPNLQNLTKDEDEALAEEFVVRRAIVPRPGMVFHMLDYDQVEYRLILEYAAALAVDKEGVLALIAKVLGGLDVHAATAESAGITRRAAKTTNFATIYGSGISLLAHNLGVSAAEAQRIRDSIFNAAPEIRWIIRQMMDAAEKRGFVVNWFGRRCHFPDARFSYRAPNYLIQGGCADIVKVAMNRVHAYLKPFATRMVLMIHDELVFEGPPEEGATVIPVVKEIMESVYPSRHLPLTCGVDHSFKSLADKKEGIA